jgi:hypothetical protein
MYTDKKQLEENTKIYLAWKETFHNPLDELIQQIRSGEVTFTDEDYAEALEFHERTTKELFGDNNPDSASSRFKK